VYENITVLESSRSTLGAGFFRRHVCLFDFPNGRLYLKPGDLFDRAECLDLDGVDIPGKSGFAFLFGKGAYVKGVAEGSRAERLGLRKGDYLVSVGMFPLRGSSLDMIQSYLFRQRDDDEFDLHVLRGDEELTFKLRMGKHD
jgi:hypothetical protein